MPCQAFSKSSSKIGQNKSQKTAAPEYCKSKPTQKCRKEQQFCQMLAESWQELWEKSPIRAEQLDQIS